MKKMEGFLRGINLGGWLSQADEQTEEHRRSFITREDILRIAEMGFTHVRLPVDWDTIEYEDGAPREEGYAHIDNCLAWCAEGGLHAVIDLHKAYGYSFDPTEKGDDKELFFRDAALQDRFISLWRRTALRYRDRPHAAFELLNEVVPGSVAESWNDIARRTAAAIREIAEDTWIIVGGVHYNSVRSVPLLGAPFDGKTVFNFHCYEPIIFTHQRAPWVRNMPMDLKVHYPEDPVRLREMSRGLSPELADAAEDMAEMPAGCGFFESLFAPAIAAAEKYGVPLYCGEYGVIDRADPADALRWIRDINTVFDRYGIGRALWNYRRKDFGIVDPHYDGTREELVRILTGR